MAALRCFPSWPEESSVRVKLGGTNQTEKSQKACLLIQNEPLTRCMHTSSPRILAWVSRPSAMWKTKAMAKRPFAVSRMLLTHEGDPSCPPR